MPKKLLGKMAADLAMTVLLLLLMAYSLIGEAAHEWLGAGMLLLFILHHVLNFGWIKNIGKGRYTAVRVLQTALAVLVLAAMLGSMLSGIAMSRYVFDFLPIEGGLSLARTVHLPCAYWGFIFMSLHLGLHWNMVMGIVRRMRKRQASKKQRIVLRIAAAVIALYGIVAFLQNDIFSYLFLRTHFVFFDYEQPLILFFADYLAMMGLFILIAHSIGNSLFKGGGQRRKEESN